jgi:hypothetical protein
MMQHLEGPIVDSFYETAIHSWYNKLSPMLPCVGEGYQAPTDGYKFGHDNHFFADIEVVQAAKAARILLRKETAQARDLDESEHAALDRFRDVVRKAMERATTTANERWDGMMATSNDGEFALPAWAERVRAGFSTRPNSRRPSYDGTMNRRYSAPNVARHRDRADMVTIGSEFSGAQTLVNDPVNDDMPASAKMPAKEMFERPSDQVTKAVKISEPEGVEPGKHDIDERFKHNKDMSGTSTATAASNTSTLKVDSAGRPRSGSGRLQMLTEKFSQFGTTHEYHLFKLMTNRCRL